MTDTQNFDLRSDYLEKIDKIPTVSFNKEQKEIAKKILATVAEKDLNSVFGLITQRVKIGFVFDEAPEVNHNCVAVVKENEKLSINLNELNVLEHKLIIGENYDALKNLCSTYVDRNGKGLIDLIYIDPPYNTDACKKDGNDYKEEIAATKFIYRDKFTRDGWLNMMNERLKLAKRLLSDKGVIFISIDDSEQAYLKVLCDEIFGEDKVEVYIWCLQDKSEGSFVKTSSKTVRKEHEYIICCFKKDIAPFNKYKSEKAFKKGAFSNPDNDPRGCWFSGNISRNGIKSTTGSKYYTITTPKGAQYTRNWTLSEEEFSEKLKNNEIFFSKNGYGVPRLKIYQEQDTFVIQSSMFTDCHTSITGKNELKLLFGTNPFDFPKPTSLIKRIICLASDKNSIILDFFAGSGTTGQAVMELNEEDGGTRQFILVTNNENNIGEKITRERLYRVINGKGSNGEGISWKYTEDKPCLKNNSVRVFDMDYSELSLDDLDKAQTITQAAKENFKKLNSNYSASTEIDVYNNLSALNPFKKDEK